MGFFDLFSKKTAAEPKSEAISKDATVKVLQASVAGAIDASAR